MNIKCSLIIQKIPKYVGARSIYLRPTYNIIRLHRIFQLSEIWFDFISRVLRLEVVSLLLLFP